MQFYKEVIKQKNFFVFIFNIKQKTTLKEWFNAVRKMKNEKENEKRTNIYLQIY